MLSEGIAMKKMLILLPVAGALTACAITYPTADMTCSLMDAGQTFPIRQAQ